MLFNVADWEFNSCAAAALSSALAAVVCVTFVFDDQDALAPIFDQLHRDSSFGRV
jgi:hypothetical protein